jgi:hypothetical protein
VTGNEWDRCKCIKGNLRVRSATAPSKSVVAERTLKGNKRASVRLPRGSVLVSASNVREREARGGKEREYEGESGKDRDWRA